MHTVSPLHRPTEVLCVWKTTTSNKVIHRRATGHRLVTDTQNIASKQTAGDFMVSAERVGPPLTPPTPPPHLELPHFGLTFPPGCVCVLH